MVLKKLGVFIPIQLQFFTFYACAAFNFVLLVTKKNLRIAGFFALIPFVTYPELEIRLKLSKYTVFNHEEK